MEIRDTLKDRGEKLASILDTMRDCDEKLSALGKCQDTELVTVAKVMGEVRDLLRDRFDQRDRVDDIDRRLTALERRAS